MALDPTPPELPQPVSDALLEAIRTTVREEIRNVPLQPQLAPTQSFVAVISAPQRPKIPPPPTHTSPAIIVKPADPDSHAPVQDAWRTVSFRNTKFAPSKVETIKKQ